MSAVRVLDTAVEAPERLTLDAERELLARACRREPASVVVASDLHLSIGRDPVTGMYAAIENFFADDAFARWLAGYDTEAGSLILVLNGDIFDFVRVTPVPRSAADYRAWADRLEGLGESDRAGELRRLAEVPDGERRRAASHIISPKEYRFGLRTDDYKNIWKLHLIVIGHEPFFDALARFLAAGGTLVIVKGNHDVELHWPLVRQALRDELVRRAPITAHGRPPSEVAASVAFADEGFTLGNVHIEHGHQYEPMTSVVGPPVLDAAPTQINYPLGSFINRYFINRLERLDPFIDNVKPVTQALLTLLRRRPITIARAYWYGWRFVLRAVRVAKRRGSRGPVLLISAALFVPPVTLALLALHIARPDWFAWIPGWLRIGGTVAGIGLPAIMPYLLGAIGEILREFGPAREEPLVSGARAALRRAFPGGAPPRRRYAVFGHTHVQMSVRLGDGGGGGEFYVNAGTWTPLWPRDRQDLIGRVYYSFARFDRGADAEYAHGSFVWDDQAGEPRAAPMLAPPE